MYDNITLIVLIEHIKNLAEVTSLSEHIHKCKLITCVIINLIVCNIYAVVSCMAMYSM